jgi:hypothetical protein
MIYVIIVCALSFPSSCAPYTCMSTVRGNGPPPYERSSSRQTLAPLPSHLPTPPPLCSHAVTLGCTGAPLTGVSSSLARLPLPYCCRRGRRWAKPIWHDGGSSRVLPASPKAVLPVVTTRVQQRERAGGEDGGGSGAGWARSGPSWAERASAGAAPPVASTS